MKKLWTAFVAGCTLMAAQSAWSFDRVDFQGTPSPEPQVVEITSVQASPARVVVRAAADGDYTEWVAEGTATMPLYGLEVIENSFNQYCEAGDEKVSFANSSALYSRALKSDASAVQYKFVNFLGYGDVVVEMDMNRRVGTLARTELSIPVPSQIREQYGTESISIGSPVTYDPATKAFTFDNPLFYVTNNSGIQGIVFQLALPLYSDSEFGAWTSLGEASVEGELLQSAEKALNAFRSEGDEVVSFVYTTEVKVRKLVADQSIVQYKFCNLLGYNDVTVFIDDVTLQGTLERTITGMPVPTDLKDLVSCKAIEAYATSVSYSPATKIFTMPEFLLYIGSGSYIDCKTVEIKIPGYRGEGIAMSRDNSRSVIASAGENVAKVVYTIVPATSVKPTDEEFAAVAAAILGQTKQYKVYNAVGLDRGEGIVELPYSDYLITPSWMVVAAADADGRPFEHFVAPLTYTVDINNVEMTETLLSCLYDLNNINYHSLKGTFRDLTLHKSVSPENVNKTVYTFDNPYVNDPGWYLYFSLRHKDENSWEFIHEHSADGDLVRFVKCLAGVHIDNVFQDDESYFLYPSFDRAYKQGDTFYFHNDLICIEGYAAVFETIGENYYVITLPQGAGDSVADMIADDNADAPVEFFDLQGRRIEHPAAGGIYIRRQGSNVDKVLIK